MKVIPEIGPYLINFWGLEGTPIVEDGFMYVTDGWGSVYKFDATKNGKLVWKMNPDMWLRLFHWLRRRFLPDS